MTNDAPPDPARSRKPGAAATSRGVSDAVPGRSSADQASTAESPTSERVVLDDLRIRRALMRIAHEIVESTGDQERLYLVAIPNGGVPLGRILARNLSEIGGLEPTLGILDTTLYRDDLSSRGIRPRLRRTEMPSSVDDCLVVLVEDVVNTGRTIRAAMDALMDFGRPGSVRVVALVDRGHRELPIKIDYVGKNIPTRPGETVQLRFTGDGESGSLEAVVLAAPPRDVGDTQGRSGRQR